MPSCDWLFLSVSFTIFFFLKMFKVLRPLFSSLYTYSVVDLIQSSKAQYHASASESHLVLPVHPLSWAPDYWHNCASTQSPDALMVIQMIFFPKMDTWFSLFTPHPSSLPQLSAWPQYSLNIYTSIPVSRHLHFSLQCISSCNHFSTMQSATVMHSHRCPSFIVLFGCKNFNQSCHPCLSPGVLNLLGAGLLAPTLFPITHSTLNPSDHTAVPPSHRRYSKLDVHKRCHLWPESPLQILTELIPVWLQISFSQVAPLQQAFLNQLPLFQSFSTPSIFLHNLFTSTWFNVFTF